MLERINQFPSCAARYMQSALRVTSLFLLIEFFDELNYGVQSTVLPAVRADLGLDYAQIGALLGVSGVLGTLVEPALLLLGDTRWRRSLMLGGGIAIGASLFLLAGTQTFFVALLAFVIGYPASGAFVSLAQATLMDVYPDRRTEMMARWSVAGSIGNLAGPLVLAAGFALGLGWRWVFIALGVFVLLLVVSTWIGRSHASTPGAGGETFAPLHPGELLPNLWRALRSPGLTRWFVLLEMADLLMDIYLSYLGLYLADVVGLAQAQVGLALGGLMLAGLLADLWLVRLLDRHAGMKVVRASALVACLVYPAMLLAPWVAIKIALALGVRFTTLGWYQVLQAEAFDSLPGRSGTVTAINSLASLLGNSLAWLVGLTAAMASLPAAMWLLLAGPLALVLFAPGPENRKELID
jgi:FSR family fosmidomycin resistance protein-like MFS transporter